VFQKKKSNFAPMKQASLFVIFLTVFIDLIGFGLVMPIFPVYIKNMGATNIEIGMITASYAIMNFIFTPLLGSYSDRFGRRPILLTTILINVIAFFIFGLANSLPLLIVSRLFSGIGSANISAAQAYISDISTPENRAKSMGMIGVAFGLGFVFGPIFGALLNQVYGIHSVGYAASALCLINLVWAYFSLPESLKTKNATAEIQFIPIQEYKNALNKSIIRELFLLNLVYIAAFMMMQTYSSLLWKEHYGLDAHQILYIFAFIGVTTAAVQGGLIGIMVKKFGEQRLLYYGCVFMMFGLGILPLMPKYLLVHGIVLSITSIAFGAGCLTPSMTSLLSQHTDLHEQGKMLGLAQSFGALARVIGPFLGGVLYDLAFWLPFVGGAGMMIGCLYLVHQVIVQIQKA
jgi:MFS transporter, DHA1 family, tetracycline resistance protein